MYTYNLCSLRKIVVGKFLNFSLNYLYKLIISAFKEVVNTLI